ncbi:amidohydrolase family protein [Paraburkholderia xenovorans]|uniref:amidohydrolase family protein n=1 Tax=Paraburkholderia xenovorans TaxID=36873 RepID=UPI001558952D|nr:amidohydrolase family protein [Paraburkholderia xenovorans]NPT37474.1 amidohydrolase family protein [Paraburkholderia xenovorans]
MTFHDETSTITGRRLSVCHHCSAGERVSLTFSAGLITGVSTEATQTPEAATTLLMPPLANAHDHVRGVSPTALAAYDLPLELWLANMTGPPPCDPFLVAAAALGRQARSGCASIMIHYTRPQRPAAMSEELRVVARAARQVGIRVAIAPALRDINALGYGLDSQVLAALPAVARASITDRLMIGSVMPPGDQIRLVDELAQELEDQGDSMIDVQYGPYGPEWCSDTLLKAVAEASATSQRRVHMHLLESPLQRQYLDARYPQGPLRFLDAIGLLSPRLSVAHAVWLRPDEMELLAERGVTVSVNTSSNLSLRNGIAPVTELYRHGVRLAQGLDGFSVDGDDDAFRELRLNYLLHRGVGFEEGLPLTAVFQSACHGGKYVVTGRDDTQTALELGSDADIMVLDRAALAHDLVMPVDDAALVAQRATKETLRQLFVAGRKIVSDGRLLSLDLPSLHQELNAQLKRATNGDYPEWRAITAQWSEVLKQAYMTGLHRRP